MKDITKLRKDLKDAEQKWFAAWDKDLSASPDDVDRRCRMLIQLTDLLQATWAARDASAAYDSAVDAASDADAAARDAWAKVKKIEKKILEKRL